MLLIPSFLGNKFVCEIPHEKVKSRMSFIHLLMHIRQLPCSLLSLVRFLIPLGSWITMVHNAYMCGFCCFFQRSNTLENHPLSLPRYSFPTLFIVLLTYASKCLNLGSGPSGIFFPREISAKTSHQRIWVH